MGMDIALYKILKPTAANIKKADTASQVYFVSIETLIATKTGKQLVAKYADFLGEREVDIWDLNAVKRRSKFYGSESTMDNITARWVGCGTRSDGIFYEDFELTCGDESETLYIKENEIAPLKISDVGFVTQNVAYLQRKGINKAISRLHKDFSDFKTNFYIYANTDEHLKALQGASLESESGLMKLKTIKDLHFIDLNA